MLVGFAIPLKTDVVCLACVFVCYICYPTVEKGTRLQLKFVDFVASPYPAESKRDLEKRVKKLTDQRMVTKTRTDEFSHLILETIRSSSLRLKKHI